MIGNPFARLGSYLKYLCDDSAVIGGIFEDHKIRFTQPADLNDPLEFRPYLDFGSSDSAARTAYKFEGYRIPSFKEVVELQNIHRFYNQFGVLSLTRQPLNYAMWSQYASGHRGVLIELNRDFIEHDCFKHDGRGLLRIQKVRYVRNYRFRVERMMSAGIDVGYEELTEKLTMLKSSIWKREQEFRVIRHLSECAEYVPPEENKAHLDRKKYLFPFSLDCLGSVTFGAGTEPATKKRIIAACRGSTIKFFQMLIVQSRGIQMRPVPVASDKDFEDIVRMRPQLFVTDKRGIVPQKLVGISALSEVPYYSKARFQIDSYLEGMRRRKTGSA
jgi:hypothetical protein